MADRCARLAAAPDAGGRGQGHKPGPAHRRRPVGGACVTALLGVPWTTVRKSSFAALLHASDAAPDSWLISTQVGDHAGLRRRVAHVPRGLLVRHGFAKVVIGADARTARTVSMETGISRWDCGRSLSGSRAGQTRPSLPLPNRNFMAFGLYRRPPVRALARPRNKNPREAPLTTRARWLSRRPSSTRPARACARKVACVHIRTARVHAAPDPATVAGPFSLQLVLEAALRRLAAEAAVAPRPRCIHRMHS